MTRRPFTALPFRPVSDDNTPLATRPRFPCLRHLCDLQPGRRSRKGGTAARGAARFPACAISTSGRPIAPATPCELATVRLTRVREGRRGRRRRHRSRSRQRRAASDRRDVVFSVWPLGSANDYAYSTRNGRLVEETARDLADGDRWRSMSVASTTGAKEEYFVCNLGVGFNGMVNGEARQDALARGDAALCVGLSQVDGEALRHADHDDPLRRSRSDDTDAGALRA